MALTWPWATLSDERQHCFRYSRKYINVSLCGDWTGTDQDGNVVKVSDIPKEECEESTCCPECLKIKRQSI